MTPIRGLVTALVLVALVGCGGEKPTDAPDVARTSSSSSSSSSPSPAADATPDSSPSTGVTPQRRARATREYREALDRMRHDEVTFFRFRWYLGKDPVHDTRGAVGIGEWSAVTQFSFPSAVDGPDAEKLPVMEVRSVGSDLWMQMRGWPGRSKGCWLVIEPGTAPVGVMAMTPGEPMYFSVLGSVRPLGFPPDYDDVVIADVELPAALWLLVGQSLEGLDLKSERVRRARARVTVTLGDGRVSALTIEGKVLLEALRGAGARTSEGQTALLENTLLVVEYPETGQRQPVFAPPAPDRMFTQGERGCH
jgi:hypothetical protein